MTVLRSMVQPGSSEFKTNSDSMQEHVDRLADTVKQIELGGGDVQLGLGCPIVTGTVC